MTLVWSSIAAKPSLRLKCWFGFAYWCFSFRRLVSALGVIKSFSKLRLYFVLKFRVFRQTILFFCANLRFQRSSSLFLLQSSLEILCPLIPGALMIQSAKWASLVIFVWFLTSISALNSPRSAYWFHSCLLVGFSCFSVTHFLWRVAD